eukprot:Gb_33048 [translate_table: standard]
MSQQHVVHSKPHVVHSKPPTLDGFDQCRIDRDLGSCSDKKLVQPAGSCSSNSGNAGISYDSYNYINSENIVLTNNNKIVEGKVSVSKSRGLGRPLDNYLLFMTLCLIGQPVEVQVKNGSIFSGIFHATNAEKDYGVVLKMARLTKGGSKKGGKRHTGKDAINKAPIKTLIILAKDLVQVIAKDVPVTGDELVNGHACEYRHDIVIDSFLSQAQHIELERELEPWTPDKDAPQSLGLEDTFQNTWNRNWDQFETNKALFGVKSTFDEELYTTKLERGPQMRDREREAYRIAREIEGQATKNFHLAEERGMNFVELLDALDEESRFSSVLREEVDDIGEDNEDADINEHNEETFGSNFSYCGGAPSIYKDNKESSLVAGESEKRSRHTSRPSSADSSEDGGSPYQSPLARMSPIISSSLSDQLEFKLQILIPMS